MSSPISSPTRSVRSPLNDSTNDLRFHSPSPPPDTIWLPKNKRLRRKASTISFRPDVGSSDSMNSGHSSIFDALSFHPSSESVVAKLPSSSTFVTGGQSPGSWIGHNIQDQQLQHPATPESPSSRTLHLPTQLETITEQRSIATLRPHRNKSIKRTASIASHASKPTSAKSPQATAGARRRLSYSLNDLELSHRYTRHFMTSSDESALRALDEPTVPNRPVHPPPPPRMPTPPGVPKFNTVAASNYRLPPPPLRFRDLFRLTKTPAELEWEAQTVGLPRGVIMRGENGVLVRNKFRPGQSGHTGRHGSRAMGVFPLQTIPCVNVNRDHIHSSRNARGVESSGNNECGSQGPLQSSIREGEITVSSNLQPVNENVDREPQLGDRQATVTRETATEQENSWVKFWEGFCHCCCGAEKDEEGQLHPQIVHTLSAGAAPGYARPLFSGISCGL